MSHLLSYPWVRVNDNKYQGRSVYNYKQDESWIHDPSDN